MLCIRGLGNVASLPEDQLRKHSTTVLSAMMNGMGDRNDPDDYITLEAMRGLSKIFAKVSLRWRMYGLVGCPSRFCPTLCWQHSCASFFHSCGCL